MPPVTDRDTFESAYAGQAPYDIGKPQKRAPKPCRASVGWPVPPCPSDPSTRQPALAPIRPAPVRSGG
jgi:hypothetical protein